MTEPNDKLSKYETSKAFRSLMFGGKVGGAFAGISSGLVAVGLAAGWLWSFSKSPNASFVVPVTLFLVCLAGFVVHFWKSPILSAPLIMFSFLVFAVCWLVVAIWIYVNAAVGEAILQSELGDTMFATHGIQFENLKTEEEIKKHIEKNKKNAHKQILQEVVVGNFYLTASALFALTAIYGFFSRLWQMENAIIDTQLRLVLLSDYANRLAHTTSASIEAIRFSIDEVEKDKFNDITMQADEVERELDVLNNGLKDFPVVGFRKGRLLFFKSKAART